MKIRLFMVVLFIKCTLSFSKENIGDILTNIIDEVKPRRIKFYMFNKQYSDPNAEVQSRHIIKNLMSRVPSKTLALENILPYKKDDSSDQGTINTNESTPFHIIFLEENAFPEFVEDKSKVLMDFIYYSKFYKSENKIINTIQKYLQSH